MTKILELNAADFRFMLDHEDEHGQVAAPPSTKNRTGERDPEMHQTQKGNQWHFGMKVQ